MYNPYLRSFFDRVSQLRRKDKESETNTVNAFKEKLIKLPDNYSIGPGTILPYTATVFSPTSKRF